MSEISLFMLSMSFSSGNLASATSLVIVAGALLILSNVLEKFGNLSIKQIVKGLFTLGVALGEIAVTLTLMQSNVGGAASMVIVAGALSIMASVLQKLGDMSLGEIAKSFIALAGS